MRIWKYRKKLKCKCPFCGKINNCVQSFKYSICKDFLFYRQHYKRNVFMGHTFVFEECNEEHNYRHPTKGIQVI